jgi:hypothetical protein
MEAVATELNEAWKGEGARVHFIREYYYEDIWSCDFLENELKVIQYPLLRPNGERNCNATRDLYHDDVHYTSIVATTNPEHIRMPQRQAVNLFSINGYELQSMQNVLQIGYRLIDYRADITVRAMKAAVAAAGG